MEIKLTKGKTAIVDAEDYEYLNQWKWYAKASNGNLYAWRNGTLNKKRLTIQMHRVIMNTPEELYTDHINGNGLDNRRSNLRTATPSQNAMNRKVCNTNHLGIKGVRYQEFDSKCKTPSKKPYKATIKVNKKNISLGSYATASDAANAYNEAARVYFGEFGRTI